MPDPALESLSHAELAVLGREYLLAGHLIDRASMPHIIGRFGRATMAEIAIDEWMGASPVYTRRMQRLLGFGGTDVATIFKGMQFDIGAPHQFLDFRYQVTDADHGEFWLDHCGALMDVEPMGDEYVTTMCHDIEDPTFDATACATNRRAQVRPIHRPPRVPADREPHCHWEVRIVHDAEPLPEPAVAELLATTLAAKLPLPSITGAREASDPEDARSDYRGDLDPDLRLEHFSSAALRAIADEACLQGHLLVQSGLLAVASRADEDTARTIGRAQFVGVAGVVATRLARAFDLPATRDGLRALLDLHPAFRPRSYVSWDVEQNDDETLALHLLPCPALDEPTGLCWPALLESGGDAALNAMVAALDPTARCVRRTEAREGAAASWDVVHDSTASEVPVEVQLTRFSTGADFRFDA